MNTIHSTFNRVNTSYTVIGAHKQNRATENNSALSVLLLSRGGRPFRHELLKELLLLDVGEVVSTQVAGKGHVDFEKETSENEALKFLILKNDVSPGEMVNIGVSECVGDFVFVLWDDMNISSKSMSYRVFEKIKEYKRVCTLPFFKNPQGEVVPSLMTPLFNKELL